MNNNTRLPVYEVIEEIKEQLHLGNRLILQAPPGAGKTTAVPLELMNEPWCKKILMLEPRRIAARNAAFWMAKTLGEKVGQRIGYTVHLDKKVSDNTVVEVVTEGVFLNRLLRDPEMTGISLIIFDEFHERSLNADLGLALIKESQEILRGDLKLLVMSATLDSEPIANYLDNAPIITSSGKSFPVELKYLPSSDRGLISDTSSAVIDAINNYKGSILVFLPGVGEIKRVESFLQDRLPNDVQIAPLYGTLSREKQERAIEPVEADRRKIVLSTSIAESSITIKGITVVVDTGLIRLPRFNPKTGLETLETISISKDSADQRTGRAGRVEAGVCLRLWEPYKKMQDYREPAILTEDITTLALSIFIWGSRKLEDIAWLTKPSVSYFNQATKLLNELQAVENNVVTEKGRIMSRMPLHPRLASMVYNAEIDDQAPAAALLSALLSERDILHYSKENYESDIEYRINAIKRDKNHEIKRLLEYKNSINRGAVTYPFSPGRLLLSAYPDRIGKNMGSGRFYLSNGQEAQLSQGDSLYNELFLIIPSLGGMGKINKIFLAARISLKEILDVCAKDIKWQDRIEYDKGRNKFRGISEYKLGFLTIKDKKVGNIPNKQFVELLVDFLKRDGLSTLNWTKQAILLQLRVSFLHQIDGDIFPNLDLTALQSDLNWLEPYLGGLNLKNPLIDIPLLDALKGKLGWKLEQQLDQYAPTHLKVPSGSNIPLDYSTGVPILKVRLQELFGLDQTPMINHGKYPVTIHLLSPASRPIQITKDLKSFWDNTYQEVKKDLKGRYPKHHWPDDPYKAQATNRIKR